MELDEDKYIVLTREQLEDFGKGIVQRTLAEMNLKGYPEQSGRVYRKQMIEVLGRVRYDEAVRNGWLLVSKHNPMKASSRVYATKENWERFLKLHTNRGI